jgi:hypothetical protein
MRGTWGIEIRGYLGFRGSRRVLGRWKDTEVRDLRLTVDDAPLRVAFLAAFAFASFESEGLAAAYHSKG